MTEQMKEILDTIQESYKQGYKDAIDKACELLNENIEDRTRSYEDYDVHDVVVSNYAIKKEFIEAFRKAMEEQQ